MKIAVLSDIHDHLDKLERVLTDIKKKNIEAIIFCGDLVSPFTTGVLAKADLPTYACLGNNDEDHIGMMKKGGERFTWFHLSQEFGQTELDGKKIALCHYPKLGELLARSEEYDVVFYGHTHISHNETVGMTLLVNPGAVCGINFEKGTYDVSSYAIYDTETNTAEIVEING